MNPESVRAMIFQEIDQASSRWLASQRQKTILACTRAYISALNGTELTKLASFFPGNLAEMSDTPEEPSLFTEPPKE